MESCIGNPGSGRNRTWSIVCRNGIESKKLHALIKIKEKVGLIVQPSLFCGFNKNYRINMLICEYVKMLICLFHALYRCAIGKTCDDKTLGVVAHLLTIGIVAASDGAVGCI